MLIQLINYIKPIIIFKKSHLRNSNYHYLSLPEILIQPVRQSLAISSAELEQKYSPLIPNLAFVAVIAATESIVV